MARLLVFSTYQPELYAAPARQHRRDARRRRRQGGQGGRLPPSTTPPSGCCGSATAPTSRTGGCRPALDAEWPYVEELFDADRRRRCVDAGVAVDPAALREPCSAYVAASSTEATLTVPEVAPRARRRPPRAAHRGSSATCSPRCSTSPARTRGPRGDRTTRPTPTARRAWALAAEVPDPEVPVSRSRTSASCATSTSRRPTGGCTCVTPDLLRLPGHGRDPRRRRRRG